MNLVKAAIERPIAVLAAVIMVVIFGFVALQTIPIQLIPDVRKPLLSITTNWRGASPVEIEREIINRQEEQLKGLEGVTEMTSRARTGRGEVFLEYELGFDMEKALLLVANRLDQIDGYPEEASEPVLNSSGSEDNPITWIIISRTEGNETPMDQYGDFAEDTIKERFERVPGVSRSNVFGGTERDLRVVVDPARLSQYGLTVPDVINALRGANSSLTAGDVDEGKRSYVVRTEGELRTVEQVRDVVLRSERDPQTGSIARVSVGDVAEVYFGYKERTGQFSHLGEPAMAVNAIREAGANVIEVMEGIRAAMAELNEFELPQVGLELIPSYDETVYIESAISLVRQNIFVGGTLAILILIMFLRSWRATTVVALSIPVSIVGSFVAMAALGRSINVISLAGIAFAVGLVVDAAIVVLENIYRLRAEGLSRREAAFKGTTQVWGAVLVSATTTVAAFAPVLLMEAEVGQLFRDIAVAISVAVVLSLIVAVSVIPALASKLLPPGEGVPPVDFNMPRIDRFGRQFGDRILGLVDRATATNKTSLIVVSTVSVIALGASWLLLPKLDYLPDGNQNFVFGIVSPPPGYNLETTSDIVRSVEDSSRHLWVSETGMEPDPSGLPKIKTFFAFASGSYSFIGTRPAEMGRAAELLPVLREPVFKQPGTFGFFAQRSLFGRGVGGDRSIKLPIVGPNINDILTVARRAARYVNEVLPPEQGHQMRPSPSLELGAPEIRIAPDPVRLADNGLSASELGQTIDAFNDGLRVAEITVDGQRMDLTLRGKVPEANSTQGIQNLPVVTRSGTVVPASSLADIDLTAGPTEIHHLERMRVVTLEISPDKSIALEEALERLETGVIARLKADGLPPGIRMGLAGSADKLTEAWGELSMNFLLAIVIVYLVMAVLFESFVYPLIIMLSVPLATAGGVLGLGTLNLFTRQPLDMLTLLGFIILIGIVVNNAILLVHQTLYSLQDGKLPLAEAIRGAVSNRMRPIFMSTLTSVFGMLPLVLFPGAGSELYRGLGSVVVGGLMLSAVLTLLIIPPLLRLVVPLVEGRREAERQADGRAHPAE